MKLSIPLSFLPALALLTVSGCAASQLPKQQLMDTHAAIDSAKELDSAHDPAESSKVSLHIKYAQDQLEIANALIEEGKDERALRMLDRAQADAELALALAKTDRSRSAATEAWNDVQDLKTSR